MTKTVRGLKYYNTLISLGIAYLQTITVPVRLKTMTCTLI